MYRLNTIRQLLLKQKTARNCILKVSNNLFTKNNITYLHKNMFFMCWGLLLRFYTSNSKQINLHLKKTLIKKLKNKQTGSVYLFTKTNTLSNSVHTFYSLFFWSFFFSAPNSLFKKNKTGITNNLNKPISNVRKLSYPLNKLYVSSFKKISRMEPFNMARPVLSYLLNVKVKPEHPLLTNLRVQKQLQVLTHCLFNDSLFKLNKNYLNRTTKFKKGLSHISKTSKAVFTLNQYLLNLLII